MRLGVEYVVVRARVGPRRRRLAALPDRVVARSAAMARVYAACVAAREAAAGAHAPAGAPAGA